MQYLKIGGTWLLTMLLAVLMVGPGSQKFTGGTWERMFRAWGYPDGFYLVISRRAGSIRSPWRRPSGTCGRRSRHRSPGCRTAFAGRRSDGRAA